jgi:hypothetical protein
MKLVIEDHGDNIRFRLYEEGKSEDYTIEIPQSVCNQYRLVEFFKALQRVMGKRPETKE